MIKAEMMGSANWAWSMYPGLSVGAMNTLLLHGSQEQKQQYLTKLASGEWSGTMCLTEPQCGTDLSQVKTRAEPLGDGRYKINGTKIWISAGDHDLTENIVHIVLARLPNAPPGTKASSSVGECCRLRLTNSREFRYLLLPSIWKVRTVSWTRASAT